MGFFTPKSAWGKQMENVPTIRETEKRKAKQKELRKARADKKKREELKKLKRDKLKNKATGGWF